MCTNLGQLLYKSDVSEKPPTGPRCSLQRERASDRCMIATSGPSVAAAAVRPMCSGVEDVVNPTVSRIAPCCVGPHESILLQIALKATRMVLVETRSVRIHVADHDGRSVLCTQLPALLQEHFCDPGMRPLIPGFVMIVRQVGVEEPDVDVTQLELAPGDRSRRVVVSRDAHPAATEKSDLAWIKQHVVLGSRAGYFREA